MFIGYEILMQTLNLTLLLTLLDKEIASKEAEINHSISQGWFDKAAKLMSSDNKA